jgi:hypothetical protein
MNLPVGAGSQFESLLAPGEVFTGTSLIFAKRATSGASAAGGAGKRQCKSRRGAALDALEGILNDIGLTPR